MWSHQLPSSTYYNPKAGTTIISSNIVVNETFSFVATFCGLQYSA
jgi:hypothetical protein